MTYKSIHIPGHLYFVTASVIGWRDIFSDIRYVEIVCDSLTWLRVHNRLLLFSFVIMPTHLHIIIKPIEHTITTVIQNFGSFTAHEIIKQLSNDKNIEILRYFHAHRRDIRSKYSVWQDIQAQNIYTNRFLRQKLEYIHNNPVSKDWNLVQDRADYRFSSACFYDRGDHPIIPIDDLIEYLAKA